VNPAAPPTTTTTDPIASLTYGGYLKVPELLSLQKPLSRHP